MTYLAITTTSTTPVKIIGSTRYVNMKPEFLENTRLLYENN